MDTVVDDLEAAFASAGYDVAETETNRDRIRIVVRDDRAEAGELRAIVEDTLESDAVLGLDVSTESSDAVDELTTVVSFRYRN